MIKQIRENNLTLRSHFDNPIEQQRASLLFAVNWAIIVVVATVLLATALLQLFPNATIDLRSTGAAVIAAPLCYGIYRLLQGGRLRGAAWMFVILLTAVSVEQVLLQNDPNGIIVASPLPLLLIPLVASGILLRRRTTILVSILLVGAVIVAALVQNQSFAAIRVTRADLPTALIAIGAILFFLLGFFGTLERTAYRSLREINERQWVTEFGLELSKVSGQNAVLSRALTLISERFGYLLTRAFIADEEGNLSGSMRVSAGQQPLSESTSLLLGDPSIVSEAARIHRPTTATAQDIPVRRSQMLASASAAAALPMIHDDTLLGVLDLQVAQQSTFSPNDLETLELAADQVASALHYAGTIRDLEVALREQESAAGRLQAQLQELRQREQRSVSDVWEKYIHGRGAAAIGYNLGNDQTLTPVPASDLPDTISTTLRLGKLHVEKLAEEQIINVPINFRNTTLGAMCFTIPREQQLSERQIEMAQIVAERLALALENTRLFEQSQAQVQRERKASEIGSLLIGSTDVRAVLNLAAEQFNEALGAVHTQIFIQPDILAEPLARTEQEEVQ